MEPIHSNLNSRFKCVGCGFIKARCLCDVITLLANKTQIIILQHPTEQKHPLGTVQILKKSLKNIMVLSGEDFSLDNDFLELIKNGTSDVALVFPKNYLKNSPLPVLSNLKIKKLFLIDGTWKKAKKIYFKNPVLQSLLHLELGNQKSEYQIRKSSMINSLSTLEAACSALTLIEPELNTKDIKIAFKKMIEFQISKMDKKKR